MSEDKAKCAECDKPGVVGYDAPAEQQLHPDRTGRLACRDCWEKFQQECTDD